MAKKYRVTLTAEERQELQALIAKGKAHARKLAHARVLLQVDETAGAARTDEETADALNLSTRTVERVRERFVEQGLAAALLPKPSTRRYERAFDGAQEARLIALACSAPPEGKSRWTLRLLTEQAVELKIVESVSHESVRQALKKTNSDRIGERCGASHRNNRPSLFTTWKTYSRCTNSRRTRNALSFVWTKRSGNSSGRCGSRCSPSPARWSITTAFMCGTASPVSLSRSSRSPVGDTWPLRTVVGGVTGPTLSKACSKDRIGKPPRWCWSWINSTRQ